MKRDVLFLPDLVDKGRLLLDDLPHDRETKFVSVTGQDGAGKTSLRDGLAQFYADQGYVAYCSVAEQCD